MRIWIFATALTLAFCSTIMCAAETVYVSPKVKLDPALDETLLYRVTVDNSAGGLVFWWRNVIARDGTGIRIYFQSSHYAPGYSVCFRWQFLGPSDEPLPRHFCAAWYDTQLHSHEILSASEAARIKSFTVENFDVEGGATSWDGTESPPGVLAHQKKGYQFVESSGKYNSIYTHPELVQGSPLYEKLTYHSVADAAGEPTLDWGRTRITRDGGEVRVYFRSENRVADYAVCFWWRFVDQDGEWKPRHFCADWMDQSLHSRQILSASEAARIEVFHLHNFDILQKGLGWNGQGYPEGMISHQYAAYTLIDRPAPSIAATPPQEYQPSTPSASDDSTLLAIGKCALMYLGEKACQEEVEEHLGRSLGGLSCAAFLQQTFGGRIDPGELAIGALADIASDSESEFWQIVGGITKVGMFMKCVDDNK